MTQWREDILGPGFECTDLDLGADEQGPLVATLVRHRAEQRGWWQRILTDHRELADVDVLYVHGWSDYFFQTRLARFWAARGANFYAVDLRRYGRSLRDGQTPGYIDDLRAYDAEIEAALTIMGHGEAGGSGRRLVLFGHSTGGLVLSLWGARNPGRAAALVLNSPWLEFQLSTVGRQVITPLIDMRARYQAKEASAQLDFGFYARAQREVSDETDPYSVDVRWRPERSHPVSPGWLRAILHGHSQVADGLGIDVPVCVMLSARSEAPVRWSENLTRADTVLDVEAVARAALKLGTTVTIERIDGALHDIFLSRHEAREDAYARLGRWTRGWAAASKQAPAGSR